MGAMKDILIEMEDDEELSPEDVAMWDAFDEYLNKEILGKPVEDIEEVRSYLSRHRWEFRMFIDMMAAPDGTWQELCDGEMCKRDYIRHEIFTKERNHNVHTIIKAIKQYTDGNWLDILFPNRD